MSALSADGLIRPLQADIADDILSDERGTISGQLDGSESTALGNINQIFADQLGQGWEVLEEAVNNFDPDNATGSRLVALCKLTGVLRRGPTHGLVEATLVLEASQSFAIGDLVAHVFNEPDNVWTNRDLVESTTAGTYFAVFQSESTGTGTTAAAGTLTVATPTTGWTSITNANDATEGSDEEDFEDLRLRREGSLARAGSGTVDAIKADVEAVDEVIQCLVEENTTDAAVGVLSAHSFRAVVWDGSPAAAGDDTIAQAIQDTRPAGILDIGSSTGNAVTSGGETVLVHFQRATEVPIYVSANIVSTVGVLSSDVKAAIQAKMPTTIGGDVVYHKLAGSVFIDGVDDYVTFTIGTAPAPVGVVTIAISTTQIATLDDSHIVLTGDVS